MAFPEGSSNPNPRLDTGSIPKVPGPHDPQGPGYDEALGASLRGSRDEALIQRDAHQCELEAQGKFHAAEIERYDRVVQACNSALQVLEAGQQEERVYDTGVFPSPLGGRNTIS